MGTLVHQSADWHPLIKLYCHVVNFFVEVLLVYSAIFNVKTMLICFFDANGIVHSEFIPTGPDY